MRIKTSLLVSSMLSLVLVAGVLVYAYWLPPGMPADFDKTVWFRAIATGNKTEVAKALNQGVTPDVSRADGWSSLRVAVSRGDVALVNMLLQHGAAVDSDNQKMPLLSLAVLQDNPAMVTMLLKAGASLSARDPFRRDAMDLAMARRQYEVIAVLAMAHNAFRKRIQPELDNIRLPGNRAHVMDHESPSLGAGWFYVKGRLWEKQEQWQQAMNFYGQALRNGSMAGLYRYIRARFSPALPVADANDGWAVLQSADMGALARYVETVVHDNHAVAGYIRALRQTRQKKPPQSALKTMLKLADDGFGPAQWAVGRHYHQWFEGQPVKKIAVKKIEYLTAAAKQGLAVAARDLAELYFQGDHAVTADEQLALHWATRAAATGLPDVYRQLAERYEKGRAVQADPAKAVQWYQKASDNGDARAARRLSHAYTDGELGLTPDKQKALHFDVTAELLQAPATGQPAEWSAEVEARLIEIAVNEDQTTLNHVFSRPVDHPFNRQLWLYAALFNNEVLLKTYLEKGMAVNTAFRGRTALINAVAGGHEALATWLLEQGADVNQVTTVTSPLAMAVIVARSSVIPELLNRGAKVDVAVGDMTPLMHAVRLQRPALAKLLLAHGADINARGPGSQTVSVMARAGGDDLLQRIILNDDDLNIDPSAKDKALSELDAHRSKQQRMKKWLDGRLAVKLDKNGQPLANQQLSFKDKPWTCVRDDVSGLTWMIKTDAGGSHDKDRRFVYPAIEDSKCKAETCDTRYYLQLLNEKKICGFDDWRLPTIKDLESLTFEHMNPLFPYWPGYAVWGRRDGKPVVVWADGLFGRSNPAVSITAVGNVLPVRGKIKPLPAQSSARFTIMGF